MVHAFRGCAHNIKLAAFAVRHLKVGNFGMLQPAAQPLDIAFRRNLDLLCAQAVPVVIAMRRAMVAAPTQATISTMRASWSPVSAKA